MNILLAAAGLSPQVITETLYGLHQQGKAVDAIHVVATRQGKERVYACLLSPTDGKYLQYLSEYEIDSGTIEFGFDNVHVVKDEHGREIEDIVSEDDNGCFLSMCLELACRFTRRPDDSVFFSIAGGRKTMSACLMLAAQLYGRPQDRVYHVLVSPEFENNRDFFYPPAEHTQIELKDRQGNPYIRDSRYARVSLVPVPFVSIRDRLAGQDLEKPMDPAALMLSVVREDRPGLAIDLARSVIVYKHREMDMMPARLALYTFFAMGKKRCTKTGSSCRGCTECYLNIEEILNRRTEIADIYHGMPCRKPAGSLSDSGILCLDAENFNSYKAKIRRDLEKGFGPYSLPEIAIESAGARPDTRYGLNIDRDRITIQ
ncbi:MAG TPA: TIGR02584 family CRISPR-associated protein [Deltaproteobacteria bacterium]|nr:TIGR02584 family CRISPR-associated protein [Deltaproteobacteria bacterium]